MTMMRESNPETRDLATLTTSRGGGHDVTPPPASIAWDVIEEACIARITGEMTLITSAPHKTRVYIANGLVYFAERDSDPSLASRLVLAGAIDDGQLQRGAIQMGGLAHLGRMFERDTTIDRDTVELAVELITEETLTGVAEEPVISYRTALYRHHPSGVARWFSRTQSADELATVPPTEPEATPVAVPVPEPGRLPEVPQVPEVPEVPEVMELAELAELASVDPYATRDLAVDVAEPQAAAIESEAIETAAVERMVMWPRFDMARSTGVVIEPELVGSDLGVPSYGEPQPFIRLLSMTPPISLSSLTPLAPTLSIEPHPGFARSASLSTESPMTAALPEHATATPLVAPDLGSIPVPEDVAAAVRRAIAAIEAATGTPTTPAAVRFGPMHVRGANQPDPPVDDYPELQIATEATTVAHSGVTAVTRLDSKAVFASFDAAAPKQRMNGMVELQPLGPPPEQTLDNPQAPKISTARRGALRRLIDGIRRTR